MLPFDITNETLTNDNFWTMSAAEKHRNIPKPANPQQRSSESKVRIPWWLTILTLCSRLLFPILLIAVSHLLFLFIIEEKLISFSAYLPHVLIATTVIILVFLSTKLLDKTFIQKLLGYANDRRAASILDEYHWRLLVKDYEYIGGRALLIDRGRDVLLLITDRRLVFAKTGFAGLGLESVTECDRLAIKSATSRDISLGQFSWIWGQGFRAAIHLEIVGVTNPQRLVFTDPHSMARVLSMLRQQPKLRPAKNGIRRIVYYEQRRALKLRYVEGFYVYPERSLTTIMLLGLLFPGAGQFCQNRIAAGFLCAVPAATIIFGIIAQPVELVELGFEQRLKITTVALFVWIVSQVEIYTHRQHLFGDN